MNKDYHIQIASAIQRFFLIQDQNVSLRQVLKAYAHQNSNNFFKQTEFVLRELNTISIYIKLNYESIIEQHSISFLKINNELQPVFIEKRNDYSIEYKIRNKHIKNSKEQFLKLYTGHSLILELLQSPVVKKSEQSLFPTQRVLYLIAFVLFSLFLLITSNFHLAFHFITAIIGMILSYIALSKKHYGDLEFGQTLCSNQNCKMQFDENSLWNYVGDISFLYFLSFLIFIVLGSLVDNSALLYLWSAYICSFIIVVVPVSLYKLISIKKLCPICLLINLVVTVQFACNFWNSGAFNSFTIFDEFKFLISLTLSSFLAFVFYKKISAIDRVSYEHNDLQKYLKSTFYSQEAFASRLKSSKSIMIPKINGDINLGSPHAQNKLTLVLDKNCDPCLDLLRKLKNIIAIYDHSEVFALSIKLKGIDGSLFNQNERAISDSKNFKDMISFKLDQLVDFVEYEKELKQSQELNQAQLNSWVMGLETNYIPLIIVNNKILPREYSLYEVNKYLLMESYKKLILG